MTARQEIIWGQEMTAEIFERMFHFFYFLMNLPWVELNLTGVPIVGLDSKHPTSTQFDLRVPCV